MVRLKIKPSIKTKIVLKTKAKPHFVLE